MFVRGGSTPVPATVPTIARPRRVLGIDPGLTRCGYAVIDGAPTPKIVALGVLRTPATEPLPARLATLLGDLEGLFDEFGPDAVAVEQVFFQANTRTAMGTAQASGLALALAERRGCRVRQYTPTRVKETVAGWGRADKAQVQRMVQSRLGLAVLPSPADAADAAALALCHLACEPLEMRVARDLGSRVAGAPR